MSLAYWVAHYTREATQPITSCCFVAFDEFMPDRCSKCRDTAVEERQALQQRMAAAGEGE